MGCCEPWVFSTVCGSVEVADGIVDAVCRGSIDYKTNSWRRRGDPCGHFEPGSTSSRARYRARRPPVHNGLFYEGHASIPTNE